MLLKSILIPYESGFVGDEVVGYLVVTTSRTFYLDITLSLKRIMPLAMSLNTLAYTHQSPLAVPHAFMWTSNFNGYRYRTISVANRAGILNKGASRAGDDNLRLN